jgi:hypothetical protein
LRYWSLILSIEQETLIRTLQTENIARNTLYTHLFLSLPLGCTLAYLPPLFNPQTYLLALLSITSLLSTAYILYYLPAGKTGIAEIDALNVKEKSKERRLPRLGEVVDKGPIEMYLPYLNLGLSGVLALAGLLVGGKGAELFSGFGYLPGLIYGFVIVAKVVMGSVDVGELEDLKYGFKGA